VALEVLQREDRKKKKSDVGWSQSKSEKWKWNELHNGTTAFLRYARRVSVRVSADA
jgi:hypothetical protein